MLFLVSSVLDKHGVKAKTVLSTFPSILTWQLAKSKQSKIENTKWIYTLNAFYNCWRIYFLNYFLGQKEFQLTDIPFQVGG